MLAAPAVWLMAALLPSIRVSPPQPTVRRAATAPRHGGISCGAAADLCVERFGATEAEAAKAEGRLLPSTIKYLNSTLATERCDDLQQRLDLSEAELKRVVLRLPSVLGYSFANLEPKLAALQQRLGLSEAELKKVVLGRPTTLGNSFEESLEPSLAALQQRLGLSEAELKKVVLGLPAVLGLSFEKNLLPKLDFLQEECCLTGEVKELRDRIVTAPAMLSYSLEGRLRPRVELCKSLDVPTTFVFSYYSKKDDAFLEQCEKAVARARKRASAVVESREAAPTG